MQQDFEELMKYCEDKGLTSSIPFCIYHKWDIVKGKGEYTAAIVSDNTINDLPSHYVTGEIPATKMYTLEHVGAYEHLGNPWTTIHMMIRNKEIKPIKDIHPWETYGNSPENTDPKDLITRIHFAVK